MKKSPVDIVFRCVFAAWLLLTTSVASSAFVHGHAGGSASHQHERLDAAFSHSALPGAQHDDHDCGVGLSAADLHRHGCLPLLGVSSYLPMSGESSGSQGKSPVDWETFIAVSGIQGVRPVSQSVAMNHWWLAAFANVAADHCCPAEGREIRSLGVALASPLCDRARHERSGVLLA